MIVKRKFTYLENNVDFLKEVADTTDNVADIAKNNKSIT